MLFSHHIPLLLISFLGSNLPHGCHPQPWKAALCSEWAAHADKHHSHTLCVLVLSRAAWQSWEQWCCEGTAGRAGRGHLPYTPLPFTTLLMSPDRGQLRGDQLLCSHLSQHGTLRGPWAPVSDTISARNRLQSLCGAKSRLTHAVGIWGHTQ